MSCPLAQAAPLPALPFLSVPTLQTIKHFFQHQSDHAASLLHTHPCHQDKGPTHSPADWALKGAASAHLPPRLPSPPTFPLSPVVMYLLIGLEQWRHLPSLCLRGWPPFLVEPVLALGSPRQSLRQGCEGRWYFGGVMPGWGRQESELEGDKWAQGCHWRRWTSGVCPECSPSVYLQDKRLEPVPGHCLCLRGAFPEMLASPQF